MIALIVTRTVVFVMDPMRPPDVFRKMVRSASHTVAARTRRLPGRCPGLATWPGPKTAIPETLMRRSPPMARHTPRVPVLPMRSPRTTRASTAMTSGAALVMTPASTAEVKRRPVRVKALKRTIPKRAWRNMESSSRAPGDAAPGAERSARGGLPRGRHKGSAPRRETRGYGPKGASRPRRCCPASPMASTTSSMPRTSPRGPARAVFSAATRDASALMIRHCAVWVVYGRATFIDI